MSKIGVRLSIPYLQGAYLAFNALPDAFFLGDGPNCLFDKAEHIHGRHDLFSTLLSCDSAHRIQHTGVNVFNIAGDCEKDMARALRRIASFPRCGVVFMGAMPMCSIVGTDYERIMRETLTGCGKPFHTMPRRGAMGGDWLDGYAGVLEALASGMELPRGEARPDGVAFVGYFMDRNEGDHRGNVLELERAARALGLEPVSIWLSGAPYERLREIRRASTIVSLPHGRKAAAILARRLGARLVEVELPFGLEASRRFVETLGRAVGREKAAADFAARELDAVVPMLEWSVPHAFVGRRFAFAGDPLYASAFVEQIEDLGGSVAATLCLAGRHHLDQERREALERRPGASFEPLPADARAAWAEVSRGGVDLVVGSTFAFEQVNLGAKFLEFGYPSEDEHFLADEPFLGFRGTLRFLSRAANAVTHGFRLEKELTKKR